MLLDAAHAGTRILYFDSVWEEEPVDIDALEKECTVFLFSSLPGADEDPKPAGTAFIVKANEKFVYLVTAKHVHEALSKAGGTSYLRVNKGERNPGDPGLGVIYAPMSRDGWLFHTDPNVDLAVFPFKPLETFSGGLEPQKQGTAKPAQAFQIASLRLDALRRKQVLYTPPGEGTDVFFTGLMVHFHGTKRNLAVVRRGSIALVPDEPVKGRYGESDYYLVEVQAYPGNSGAPVYAVEGDDKHLLGVLAFAYPDLEELRKVRGKEDAYYNLGISLVVPVEKLMDIVDSESEKKRRGEDDELISGVDLSASEEPIQELTKEAMEAALRRVSRPGGKEVIEKLDEASSGT